MQRFRIYKYLGLLFVAGLACLTIINFAYKTITAISVDLEIKSNQLVRSGTVVSKKYTPKHTKRHTVTTVYSGFSSPSLHEGNSQTITESFDAEYRIELEGTVRAGKYGDLELKKDMIATSYYYVDRDTYNSIAVGDQYSFGPNLKND